MTQKGPSALLRLPAALRDLRLLVRYLCVVGLILFCCCLGLSLGVHGRMNDYAGWGGALGTALAFGTLFARRDNGLWILNNALERVAAEGIPADKATDVQVAAIMRAMRINSNGQTWQNGMLAAGSITGTLFWGFGQKAADSLKGHLGREISFQVALWLLYFAVSTTILRRKHKDLKALRVRADELPS